MCRYCFKIKDGPIPLKMEGQQVSRTEYVVNLNPKPDFNPSNWREKQGIGLIWLQCKGFLWSPWSPHACGCHLTPAILPKQPPRVAGHANNVWGFQISDNLPVHASSGLFRQIIILEWVGDHRYQLPMILTWQTGAQTDTVCASEIGYDGVPHANYSQSALRVPPIHKRFHWQCLE